MDQEFFEYHINALKEKYPVFGNYQDYHVFTLLCIKYFFFNEDGIAFDPDIILEYLTDGANDGGIDAVFNDPGSDNNDLIIVQSKYYKNTDLKPADVAGELYKISESLKKLKSNKVSEFSEKLVSAYRNATAQMEDAANIRIYFFTSYQPKNKRERNKLDKDMGAAFKAQDFEVNFYSDIEAQIELCDNGKPCVDFDKLEIDGKDNFLKYEDSVIVNISALSLQDLQNRRRNGLLGRNLRYYVRQKAVDSGIEETIKKEPENFWYKNNGILIICDDYKIDGKEIKLWDFSIVNGGQTTNRIGRLDIEKDFYLQCKVVKSKGAADDEKDRFAFNIAEATNSQKPIKKADLKANAPEQMRLKERLAKYSVYYLTKKGDKAPKQFSEAYQVATLETVGKLSLAAVLQMPGTARSNSQRMYNDELYYPIFRDGKASVIADLLKLHFYYDRFIKTNIKDRGYDEKTVLPMMKNGRMYLYACVVFLCKIRQGIFTYESIQMRLTNIDALKAVLRQMDGMDRIFCAQLQDEEEIVMEMYSIIGEVVLGYCFEAELERAEEEQRTVAASDFLKSDPNYYKSVIKRLWTRYNGSRQLKDDIERISAAQEI